MRPPETTRRDFLAATAALAMPGPVADDAGVRVVVWDERQPAQRQAYGGFLGDAIAAHLATQPGMSVRSVAPDDPGQGLTEAALDACDVLIWWGHARQAVVTPEVGRRLVQRVVEGRLSLVALHSAHWSTPFVEAMNERARRDARAALGPGVPIVEVPPSPRYAVPRADARPTPCVEARKFPDGTATARLILPSCVFPAYRADGKPSTVRTPKPDHPIAAGIPARFEIPQTEMYDEPFHVPAPDEVLFEECWPTGEWFRSGMLWRLGKGRVFYFRPGHETYPVYKQPIPLRILANAARWLKN